MIYQIGVIPSLTQQFRWIKKLFKMNNYPEVVKRIHNEFNNAGERLLQESLSIINSVEVTDKQKTTRLNSVGFVNTEAVKKAKQVEEHLKTPKEWAEIVMKYQREFPLHKFISAHDIDVICKKYNLVKGNVGQYTGFVPDKNLNEIENFKTNGFKKFHINKIKFEFRSQEERECKEIEKYVKYNNSILFGKDIGDIEWFLKTKVAVRPKYTTISLSIEAVELPSVFDICAPKKDMISDKKWSLMNSLFETKFEYIPDPVVLFPVEHGAIIVTAWGDEASDPIVVNENNN